jgi:hypothetical protein
MREARRAGTYPAASATIVRTTNMPANVCGSWSVTLSSRPEALWAPANGDLLRPGRRSREQVREIGADHQPDHRHRSSQHHDGVPDVVTDLVGEQLDAAGEVVAVGMLASQLWVERGDLGLRPLATNTISGVGVASDGYAAPKGRTSPRS